MAELGGSGKAYLIALGSRGMTLRSIDGGKAARAKVLAKARVLTCTCGSTHLIEVRIGVAVDDCGRVIHKGTIVRKCAQCGKVVE